LAGLDKLAVQFSSLIASNKFSVTAITREESSSTFPDAVTVQRGNYISKDFLIPALRGQEVLIGILGTMAQRDIQSLLIEAAAGVPWVLPCEFGPDSGNPAMAAAVCSVQRSAIETKSRL
jgi:hypothetical protein